MESPLSNTESSSTILSGAMSSSPPDRTHATQSQVPPPLSQVIAIASEPPHHTQQSGGVIKRARSDEQSGEAERPIADIISEQFPAFDADAHVVRQFSEEATRDAKFEEGAYIRAHTCAFWSIPLLTVEPELGTMLLNVMMKTHAWAASRPRHEAAIAGRTLETEIAQIMQTEAEQGTLSPPASLMSTTASVSSFGERVVGRTFL